MISNFINSMMGGKKEKSFPDEYFTDFIQNTKTLTEQSKKIYIRQLGKITDQFFPSKVTIWYVLTHPDEFQVRLKEYSAKQKGRLGKQGLSQATLAQIMAIMISLFNNHPELREDYMDLIKHWKRDRATINEPLQDHYLTGTKTSKQQKAYIPWNDIIRIRDKLPNGSVGKLLVSMYTMIPPLRCEFGRIRIYPTIPKTLDEDNYIILDQKKLVLNKFKTASHQDPIDEKLPKELMDQIYTSLNQEPRDYLFCTKNDTPYENVASFNTRANNLLRAIFKNEYFTTTMFRHSFLSNQPELSKENISSQRKVAQKMGHTLTTAQTYKFKNNNKKGGENEEESESESDRDTGSESE